MAIVRAVSLAGGEVDLVEVVDDAVHGIIDRPVRVIFTATCFASGRDMSEAGKCDVKSVTTVVTTSVTKEFNSAAVGEALTGAHAMRRTVEQHSVYRAGPSGGTSERF